ncbi:hypothetical protein Xbed_00720 [Xenorhabdus beddingii]|uniref:Uncharacterized protein n=1 Tax=Xenorhabdus beddingii TaxID=40578 RepID=A0A1Y2SQ18_9GAMM|nr:hypothetical protein Xbed_00720 [Xenorhabdus beddingii]
MLKNKISAIATIAIALISKIGFSSVNGDLNDCAATE